MVSGNAHLSGIRNKDGPLCPKSSLPNIKEKCRKANPKHQPTQDNKISYSRNSAQCTHGADMPPTLPHAPLLPSRSRSGPVGQLNCSGQTVQNLKAQLAQGRLRWNQGSTAAREKVVRGL